MFDIFLPVFFFVLGSLIGSFLNVCIHRLPLSESIVWPGSHCPKCGKSIPWYLNIPLFSYIFLGGRCRFCRKRISFRYFVVEALTASVFLFYYFRWGVSFDFLFYAVFTCGLMIATFVDLRHRIIPDEISLGGIVAGFLLKAVTGIGNGQYDYSPAIDSFFGILAGGGVIFLMGYVFDTVYFKILKKPAIQGETESMGGGDVKLLAMIGAFLGWKAAILTFFLAPFLGIAVGTVNLIRKKDHTIPYGPFLSIAALITVFWADKILNFIFPVQFYH